MKTKRRVVLLFAMVLAIHSVLPVDNAVCAIQTGKRAPTFALSDIDGHPYKLIEAQGRQMTVLFFFDAQSTSSQGGLLMLDRLLRQYKNSKLTVWGVTQSKSEDVRRFIKKSDITFPILLDTTGVSKHYDAQLVLPVVCSLGPQLQVLDYFQGGGEHAEAALVRLAERQIHRDQPALAHAIATTVSKEAPTNAAAKAVQGYAALAEGKPDQAKKVFDEISAMPGKDAIIGKEGQAVVLARQGRSDEAMALAESVVKAAPERAVPHKVKGDLLIAKGDRKAAEAAYKSAVASSEAAPFQMAETYNQIGRWYAQSGEYKAARDYFEQAIAMDPYYLEPTSNKGVTYEKEGLWRKALTEYRKALALDKTDTVAGVLARKAEEMMALQKDAASKKRIDQLIDTLVKRYKSQAAIAGAQPEDDWTSRPMVLTFVDIQESGGLPARDGLSIALATRLGELLTSSGRVQVVERAVLERLLSELNLGASELTDPQTTLKLGRVLAAKLIGTGALLYLPDSTMLNLRMIDTETTQIAKTITHRLPAGANLDRELFDLNRELLKTVMAKYPLRGYVVQVEGKQAMLNIGRNQGVTTGTTFDVIEKGEAITYKGRVLRREANTVGRLEVVKVEPDVCFARIVEQKRLVAQDDPVKEVLVEIAAKGGKDET
ncbi:MAG: tetratricopeptide repeat protein [Desulfatitalea sp.]|nr:tetratricopeptide repeat protein [Desulfatitalea sp.]NNK02371.1 tetratricopeptide repeat protein [Desulfatitalea sp.]